MSWISKVDFAWIGADKDGHLGLFYINGNLIPEKIKKKFKNDSYNSLTAYIIDELEQVSEVVEKASKKWAIQDAKKGIYVFEYDEQKDNYIKVAEPKKPIFKEQFISSFNTTVIIDIKNINFTKNEEYSAGQLYQDI